MLCAAVAASLLGCSGLMKREPEVRADASGTSGLEVVDTRFSGVLFIKPDHHMGSYDRLMVDPIIVTFKKGGATLRANETQQLQAYLREATARELVNVEPEMIVAEAGPCAMRMRIAFVDLDLARLARGAGSSATFLSSYGAVTLYHELQDSMTGEVLLRYVGRRSARGGSWIGVQGRSNWHTMKPTFDRMLADLQQNLISAVPRSVATTGPQAQCGGAILKHMESLY